MAKVAFNRHFTQAQLTAAVGTASINGTAVIDGTWYVAASDATAVYVGSTEGGSTAILKLVGQVNGNTLTGKDITDLINDYLTSGESPLTKILSVESAEKALNDVEGNEIDTTYLKKSGGTMTGNLVFGSDVSIKGTFGAGTFDVVKLSDDNVVIGDATLDTVIHSTNTITRQIATGVSAKVLDTSNQSLTDAEKTQVRTNIGAASSADAAKTTAINDGRLLFNGQTVDAKLAGAGFSTSTNLLNSGYNVVLRSNSSNPFLGLKEGNNLWYAQASAGKFYFGPTSTKALMLDQSGNGEFQTGYVKATKIIKKSGTSSQFLKADGSVDETAYQAELVSGTNIKTVNNNSLLGSGNIAVDSDMAAASTGTGYIKNKVGGFKIKVPNDDITFNKTATYYSGDSPIVISQADLLSLGVPQGAIDVMMYKQVRCGFDNNGTRVCGGVAYHNYSETSDDSICFYPETDEDVSFTSITIGNLAETENDDESEYFAIIPLPGSYVPSKQDKLISGTNIKTINGQSILGGGDITVGGISGTGITHIVAITESDYEALAEKDPETLYIVTPDAALPPLTGTGTQEDPIDGWLGNVVAVINPNGQFGELTGNIPGLWSFFNDLSPQPTVGSGVEYYIKLGEDYIALISVGLDYNTGTILSINGSESSTETPSWKTNNRLLGLSDNADILSHDIKIYENDNVKFDSIED